MLVLSREGACIDRWLVVKCAHQEYDTGWHMIMSAPHRRLTSLRRLSLQSNRLASMAGFEHCIHLEELYLSHNGISKLEVRFL